MRKNKIFILLVIIVLLSLIFFIRFFIGGDEDTWICENGKIVKHGNPKGLPNINCDKDNENNLIGGQKDKHGCLIPAGYSWCEVKKKCLRTWEEPCSL